MATKGIPKKIERIVKDYVTDLKKDQLPIEEVFVFGSFAKGNPHTWSDIDVCIISPKFKDAFDALQYLWLKRIKHTNPHTEPIGFSPKDFAEDSSLTHEIKQHGVKVTV